MVSKKRREQFKPKPAPAQPKLSPKEGSTFLVSVTSPVFNHDYPFYIEEVAEEVARFARAEGFSATITTVEP